MKKILIFLIFLVLMLSVKGQLFPVNQSIGNGTTNNLLYTIYGAPYSTVGSVMAKYQDTTSANLNPYIKNYSFAQIATWSDNKVWYRNYAKTAWIQFGTGGTPGSGTVTSVGLTVTTPASPAFSVSNTPITTSGNIALNVLGTTSQYIRGDGSLATSLVGTNFWGILGNASTVAGTNFIGTTDNIDFVFKRNSVESGRINASGSWMFGLIGTTLGSTSYAGSTSGAVTIKPQAAAGTYNFNLPTTAGVDGYLLKTRGGGSTAMEWVDPTTIFTATPTLQQVITAGSILTQTDTIYGVGAHSLVINNPIRFDVTDNIGNRFLNISIDENFAEIGDQQAVFGNTNLTVDWGARVIDLNAGDLYSKIKVADSILIMPETGRLLIDTLNNETFQNTLIGWTTTTGANRGKVGYVTIGSGLSIGSGVLSATGGGSGTVNSGTQYRIAYYATTGTAVSEAAAITASRALVSDANGVPTHSTTTTTQLQYLNAATGTTGTTSTNLVFSTSPTLVTPVLGVATATSINKLTITAPTTSATLTVVDGSSLITSGAFALTLTSSATSNATIPAGTNTLYSTLSGSITSSQLRTSLTDENGTGVALFDAATSPSITTSLTTASTTFALFNTTATTVNAFGATTALNIGAAAATILNFGGHTSNAELRFLEPSGAGTNYVGFKTPATLAGNTTYLLPNAYPAVTGYVLSSTDAGTMSWVAQSSGGWGLTGNAGTTAGTNFIGTTDAIGFMIKVNSVQKLYLPSGTGSLFYVGENAGLSNSGVNVNALGLNAGNGNTADSFNGLGQGAGQNNTGEDFNGFGVDAGKNNTGRAFNGLGVSSGDGNTGDNVNSMGENSGVANSGTNVNIFGYAAGVSNAHSNVTLFGHSASASADYQMVFNNSVANARFDFGTVAADRLYTMQNASGTIAFIDLAQTWTGVQAFTSPSAATSLTTGSSTFALLNTTATTVNAFAATTTLNMGASATMILNLGGSTTASEFRFLEPSGSGTNYTAWKAVAQGGNITYSLPPSLVAGGALTDVAGNGVLTWVVPSGGSGLTVGTTTITSGTNTRILYNNSGTLGEYTLTGSGTVVAMQTAPTFVTSATVPLLIGGTGTTDDLFLKTTSGVGATGADMHFLVGNNGATEAMTIQNDGLIGIGLTSGGDAQLTIVSSVYPLRVATTFDESAAASLGIYSTSDGNLMQYAAYNGIMYLSGFSGKGINIHGNGFANRDDGITVFSNNAVRMGVYGAGDAQFDASGNITSSSDTRLKTAIQPYKSGLKELLLLKPIQYKWNDKSGMETNGTYAGFSAQNVKSAIPLGTGENADGYLSLQERAIVATLVNAVQEQQNQIEELKKEIKNLKK